MSTLVSDIINQAFVDLGVNQPGDTVTGSIQTAAFLVLQQMYASWSLERLMVNNEIHQAFQPTVGLANYTMGVLSPGTGIFVSAQIPLSITAASAFTTSSSVIQFRKAVKLVSWDEFSATVSDNLATSSILPEIVGFDPNYPSIQLQIHPVPAASPGILQLSYWYALAQFATVSDVLSLEPGYELALHQNLAMQLYPTYPRNANPEVLAANAQNSKKVIADLNASKLGMGRPAPEQGG